jgi:Leucine-rich repeat (LRR) protein
MNKPALSVLGLLSALSLLKKKETGSSNLSFLTNYNHRNMPSNAIDSLVALNNVLYSTGVNDRRAHVKPNGLTGVSIKLAGKWNDSSGFGTTYITKVIERLRLLLPFCRYLRIEGGGKNPSSYSNQGPFPPMKEFPPLTPLRWSYDGAGTQEFNWGVVGLSELCIQNTQLRDLNVNFFEVSSDLIILNLYNNNLKFLSDSTYNFRFPVKTRKGKVMPFILAMILSSNDLQSLPENFGMLTTLKYLDLSYNTSLEVLPSSFGKLKDLTELYIRNTPIKSFPKSMTNLTGIKQLHYVCMYNAETLAIYNKVPSSISNIPSLEKLTIGSSYRGRWNSRYWNRRKMLEDAFNLTTGVTKLINLKQLNISSRFIKRLPHNIGNLSNLQKLKLSGSSISKLPNSIGKLSKLKSLNLRGTLLEHIPFEIGKLKSLKILVLSRTRIKDGGNLKVLFELENLMSLDLSYTDISALPDISKLKNLRKLNLSHCKNIKSLPKGIGKLKKLRELNISATGIYILPDELSQCTDLKKLTLTHTYIHSIPASYSSFKLRELNMAGTTFHEYPSALFLHLKNFPEYIQSWRTKSLNPAPPHILSNIHQSVNLSKWQRQRLIEMSISAEKGPNILRQR